MRYFVGASASAWLCVAAIARTAAADCAVDAAALRDDLTREAVHVREWTYGWAIGYAGATVGQLAAIEVLPRSDRDSLWVGAGEAGIAALAQVVAPVAIDVPAAALNGDRADACVDLAALRAVQARAGRDERNAFWLTHIGGLALNGAGFAILAADHQWSQGALSFAVGYAVALAQAYSLPRRQWHAWRELVVAPMPGGVAISARF